MRLHIGGEIPKEGWTILNIQPGEKVDIVGSCLEIPLENETVDEVYASHVLEHLTFQEAKRAVGEFHRVLCSSGVVRISVPDLTVLCQLFASPQITPEKKIQIQRIIYGGQIDQYDYHLTGFFDQWLYSLLDFHGFGDIKRVDDFGLFPGDCSSVTVEGVPISLNVEAKKLDSNGQI